MHIYTYFMRFLLFIISSFLLFYSCSKSKEIIIDTETGVPIAGYSRDCRFQIGKTKKEEILPEELAGYKQDSLYLSFQYASGEKSDKLISAWAGGKYVVSKGLRLGDSVKKARSIYGKPKATVIEYWRNESIHWEFHGLFYPHLVVLTDSSFTNVLGISVGEQFPIDKKYIKK